MNVMQKIGRDLRPFSLRRAAVRRSLRAVCGLTVLLTSLAVFGQTEETPWQTQAATVGGSVSKNISWPYTMGYHFQPTVAGDVIELGGLFNGTKTVTLWERASGQQLAQAQVTAANVYAYTAISPVALDPAKEYTVAVTLAGSGGSYQRISSNPRFPQDAGSINISSSTYISGSGRPTNNYTYNMLGMADIKFVAGAAGGRTYGMWNWDPSILGDNTRTHELIQYCLDLGITDLSFSINWNEPFAENPNNIPAIENMLTLFHANNIKVELLVGNANWIYHDDIGPLQGLPVGGEGYNFGRQLIERFVEYQDNQYQAVSPAACVQCFDGVRLDVEPHGLRPSVTNGQILGATDPRKVAPTSDNSIVAISGFDTEPLLWIDWNSTHNNGIDSVTGAPLPQGAFRDTSVADRGEIMRRFYNMLVLFKAQMQDDRGAGHITSDVTAVADHMTLSTDQVPWYWVIGVQDEDGNFLGENHPQVDTDGDQIPDTDAFKAALSVPDRVALMGYRDKYFNANAVPPGSDWSKSVKLWDEGDSPVDLINGPRGALPYLQSIGTSTSVGLEFIDQLQLGFNSDSVTFGEKSDDPSTYQRNTYTELKDVISKVDSDLTSLYPVVEGLRYHEYIQSKPGKAIESGELFPTFSTWAQQEVFNGGNLGDWQAIHGVGSTTPNLPSLISVPTVANPDTLGLSLGNGFNPGPALSGYLQATITGLPVETDPAKQFYVVASVRVLGDTNYFQSGRGYPDSVTNDGGTLPASANGDVNSNGFFHISPIRIGDVTAAKIVWWIDLFDANNHFIRRFVLDPNDHSDPGLVLPADRFYDATDPLNVDVAGILPTPIDLTFNLTVNGDLQKSDGGVDNGSVSGQVTGWGALDPSDYHVRTWVEYTHGGENAVANTDPNWQSEVNVWSLLSQDVPIDSAGNFTAINIRPINPTGDSDASGANNGNYKVWISVHETGVDGMARASCPAGPDGIKPSVARFLDMDFSLLDLEPVDTGSQGGKGIDLGAHFVSVDNNGGKVSGNAIGLDPSKTYYAYVWADWYDFDKNIWQERGEPIGSNTVDQSKGGYFEVPITQVIPPVLAGDISVSDPRNIWVSIHDRPLDLNEFDIIQNWTCGGDDPAINQNGGFPLWLGRYFHMDSSFDYYEGFRPAQQSAAPSTATPGAPGGLALTVVGSSSIRLDWSDNANNELGFKIERDSGAGFTEIAKIHGTDSATHTYEDADLIGSTSYAYRIRAFNVIGTNSGYSNNASATTDPAGPPSLPSVTFQFGGAGGWIAGQILNMPVPSTSYNIRTWIKTDNYYTQGKEISPAANGSFNIARLFGAAGSGTQIYVTLHPDTNDPWGTGNASNVNWWNWPGELGPNVVVFGPFATQ